MVFDKLEYNTKYSPFRVAVGFRFCPSNALFNAGPEAPSIEEINTESW